MSLLAVEVPATLPVATGAYDSTKWNLGSLIKQRTDFTPGFIGPSIVGIARPVEQSAAIPGIYSSVISKSDSIDLVFLADNAAAATNRRIQLYEYNKNTSVFSWKGFITMSFPAGTTNMTVRGFRVAYKKYSDGTVSVTGNTVTGTSTLWQSTNQCGAQTTMGGSRIGFGSTDPNQITTWYYIDTISAEGTLTIRSNASGTAVNPSLTIAGGSPYVIEDLKIVVVNTAATTTSYGGLFLAKGVSLDHFSTTGNTILCTATNGVNPNMCNVYWLGDLATGTNISSAGVAIEPETSWTSQMVYVLDTTGGAKIYKYNIRGTLSVTTLSNLATIYKSINQFQFATGAQAVTGTVSLVNNGTYAVVSHGPTSGVEAFFFVTTTRIYACLLSDITSGSTTFLSYTMTEIPPGGINTFAATSALACIEYADNIDRFVVISSGAAGVRSYVTQFRADGGQMDHIFLCDDKQIDQSTADNGATPHVSIKAITQTLYVKNGICYLAGLGSTIQTNIVYAIPLGADWTYVATTGQMAISPAISTPNCNRFQRVFMCRDRIIGGDIIGKPADPAKIFYRTSGISDNSGTWNLLQDGGSLTGISPASQIQIGITFKCISDFCIAPRVFGVGVLYQDLSTDSHYQPSATFSDSTLKKFAWRFSTAFGSTVPTLRLRLYDAITSGLILDEYSNAPTGTWEKSTNSGVSWSAYDTADKSNDTTYIRFTPASLGDDIVVRAMLTIA